MFEWFKKTQMPQHTLNEAIVEDFSNPDALVAFFKQETGVTFERQYSIVVRKLQNFCRQRAIYSFEACYDQVQNDPTLKQELINYLTTNESFFFREYAQIEALADLISRRSDQVSILCAPCATGEEPYSIAIALIESGIHASRFHITGIDINTDALKHAKKACYNERSVRNLSEIQKERYFVKDAEHYCLVQEITSCVTLHQMNIFDPVFQRMEKFDYVFSRNMLIYFDKETKARAQAILESMRRHADIPVFFGHADLF